jgi:AcrR family transcriptional regulator
MGSNERRERARMEVRARILDAARELFATEGADNVTMRRIADRIEYTPTTIYQHFKDKNALLETLMAEDFLSFSKRFATVLAMPDPIERIDAMSRAYFRFAMDYPNHYRLLFMSPLPEVSGDLANRGVPERDAYAALRHIMNEAMASKRLKPQHTNVQLACQTAWSCVHGVAALAIAMRSRKGEWFEWRPVEEIFETMNEFVMRGLVREDDVYFKKGNRP